MIASPSPSQSGNGARGTPQAFQSPESPVLTPVKRSVTNDPVDSTPAAHVAVVAATLSPNIMNTHHSGPVAMTNGQSTRITQSRPSFPNAENFEIIKSATLPANVHHLRSSVNAHNTDTLQSTDGAVLSGDDEKPKPGKKVKKQRSFRIPSFSRKKKN
ncbi:hypothetical protein FGIG_01341 [Fasciola gigantica]|uniref:Uncharacterized protein n=1 Tax=Fasciola gigantica TaxID=46835 RepID=A0A504YI62_FASGI|nr:hypothetical protein FGIG_01341 [Fasciola gigantica]